MFDSPDFLLLPPAKILLYLVISRNDDGGRQTTQGAHGGRCPVPRDCLAARWVRHIPASVFYLALNLSPKQYFVDYSLLANFDFGIVTYHTAQKLVQTRCYLPS